MKKITLPIDNKKDEIINAIKNNDTVIITAETGSGKSTKVPQYLYEMGYNVIVTEPRRIAAISLAEFVSESMVNSGALTADQANNGGLLSYCF